jgi:hypothetical protein
MAAGPLRRNWEIFLLLLIIALQYASGHTFSADSHKGSDYALISQAAAVLIQFHKRVVPVLLPIMLAVLAYCMVTPCGSRSRRLLIDFMAATSIFKIAVIFILLNLMILFPPSDRVMPILQLLLFLPCLLLIWGWIYWRVDIISMARSGRKMFLFTLADDESPGPYDYILASFTSLLSTTLSGFSGNTRTARTLIYLHGLMMWDIMGLALSRAISLAAF